MALRNTYEHPCLLNFHPFIDGIDVTMSTIDKRTQSLANGHDLQYYPLRKLCLFNGAAYISRSFLLEHRLEHQN